MRSLPLAAIALLLGCQPDQPLPPPAELKISIGVVSSPDRSVIIISFLLCFGLLSADWVDRSRSLRPR